MTTTAAIWEDVSEDNGDDRIAFGYKKTRNYFLAQDFSSYIKNNTYKLPKYKTAKASKLLPYRAYVPAIVEYVEWFFHHITEYTDPNVVTQQTDHLRSKEIKKDSIASHEGLR